MRKGLRASRSIGRQISIAITIPLVLFTLLFIGVLYQTTSSILKDHVIAQFEQRLQLNMANLRGQVTEDVVNSALHSKTMQGVLYDTLTSFTKANQGLQNAYVISKVDGKDVILALSNEDAYLTELPFTAEQDRALKGNTLVISPIYSDDWGTHMSIFFPYDKEDSVIGIDMDASFVIKLQRYILVVSLVFFAASLVVGGLTAWIVGRRLAKPIIAMVESTKRLAEGDLTVTIALKRQDELGLLASSFEEMRLNLTDIIHRLRQNASLLENSSSTLFTASSELTQGSNQVVASIASEAQAAEERAVHLEHVSQLVQAVSESVHVVDQRAVEIAELSGTAQRLSRLGNEQAHQIATQMQDIQSSGAETSEQLQLLEQRTQDISNVMGMIREISSQINMLSLNASIEAARAGENGRGFAVVAQEIQRLANQTNASVGRITESIGEMSVSTDRVLQANAKSSQAIEKGVELIMDNGKLFDQIQSSVSHLAGGVSNIASHTVDIAKSAAHTMSTVQEVTAISEESVATSEEISATTQQQDASIQQLELLSRQIQEMAQDLGHLMTKFKI